MYGSAGQPTAVVAVPNQSATNNRERELVLLVDPLRLADLLRVCLAGMDGGASVFLLPASASSAGAGLAGIDGAESEFFPFSSDPLDWLCLAGIDGGPSPVLLLPFSALQVIVRWSVVKQSFVPKFMVLGRHGTPQSPAPASLNLLLMHPVRADSVQ